MKPKLKYKGIDFYESPLYFDENTLVSRCGSILRLNYGKAKFLKIKNNVMIYSVSVNSLINKRLKRCLATEIIYNTFAPEGKRNILDRTLRYKLLDGTMPPAYDNIALFSASYRRKKTIRYEEQPKILKILKIDDNTLLFLSTIGKFTMNDKNQFTPRDSIAVENAKNFVYNFDKMLIKFKEEKNNEI